jgi:hypothetical protein
VIADAGDLLIEIGERALLDRLPADEDELTEAE